MDKTLNSKHEIRSTKQIRMTEVQNSKLEKSYIKEICSLEI